MKIIEPKVEEIKDFEGVDNFYKAVARAARICYASDKTTDDKELCERLIKLGHHSPFEHAIITLRPSYFGEFDDAWASGILEKLYSNKFTLQYSKEITVNGRIIVECVDNISELDEFLEFIKSNNLEAKPEINPLSFKSFIVDTSIGCTRELNTHKDNCYHCEQSTRYCNFSKNKFGNEVAFNKPYWYDSASSKKQKAWEFAMGQAEYNYINNQYMFSIDEIRGMLPIDTHSRAIYTATIEEWQHIIDLRLKGTTGTPHGDIIVIAEKINDLIFNKNIRTA